MASAPFDVKDDGQRAVSQTLFQLVNCANDGDVTAGFSLQLKEIGGHAHREVQGDCVIDGSHARRGLGCGVGCIGRIGDAGAGGCEEREEAAAKAAFARPRQIDMAEFALLEE